MATSKRSAKPAERAVRKVKTGARKAKKTGPRVATKAKARVAKKVARRRPVTVKTMARAGRAFVARSKPETLRLRSVGPSLTVDDIGKSVVFYRDALGFVVRERWERGGVLVGVELAAGKMRLWLGQDDWKKGRDRVKGEGLRIYCVTTQDIDALAARVKGAGVSLAEEPKDQPWGGRDFAVADPDGFLLTFAREE